MKFDGSSVFGECLKSLYRSWRREKGFPNPPSSSFLFSFPHLFPPSPNIWPWDPEDGLRLHSGPARNSYMEQSFHGLNPVLRLPVSLGAVEEAEANAGLTGAPLRRWLDGLLEGHWSAADVCSMGPSVCPVMQRCRLTAWSSASPDTKSELTPPREDGRIR